MTDKIYDAGLQAAIHAARAKVSVLVMGKPSKSSLHRAHIENYCCMERTSGEDLLQQGIQQAEAAGTNFPTRMNGSSSATKAGKTSGAGRLFWPWVSQETN
jgi:thioredoxin reductase